MSYFLDFEPQRPSDAFVSELCIRIEPMLAELQSLFERAHHQRELRSSGSECVSGAFDYVISGHSRVNVFEFAHILSHVLLRDDVSRTSTDAKHASRSREVSYSSAADASFASFDISTETAWVHEMKQLHVVCISSLSGVKASPSTASLLLVAESLSRLTASAEESGETLVERGVGLATRGCGELEGFSNEASLQYCLCGIFVFLAQAAHVRADLSSIVARKNSGVLRDSMLRFGDLRNFVLDILLAKASGRAPAGGSSVDGSSKNDDRFGAEGAPLSLTLSSVRSCKALYHAEFGTLMILDERDACGRVVRRPLLVAAVPTGRDSGAVLRVVDLVGQASPSSSSATDDFGSSSEFPLTPSQGNVTALLSLMHSGGPRSGSGGFRLILVATADGWLRGYTCAAPPLLDLVASSASHVVKSRPEATNTRCPTVQKKKLEVQWPSCVTCLAVFGDDGVVVGDSGGGMLLWLSSSLRSRMHLPDTMFTSLSEATMTPRVILHQGAVTAIAADPPKHTVFTAGLDYVIVEYDVKLNVKVRSLVGHRQMITCMVYCEREHVLASCGTEYRLYAWPLEMSRCSPHQIPGPTRRSMRCMRLLSSAPSSVVTLDSGGVFVMWNLRTFSWTNMASCDVHLGDGGEPLHPAASRSPWTTFVEHPTSHELICSAQRKLYFMSIDTAGKTTTALSSAPKITAAHDPTTPIAHGVSQDGMNPDCLVSAAGDAVYLWNVATARKRHTVSGIVKLHITSMLVVAKENLLVLGMREGRLAFVQTTTFRLMTEFSTTSTEDIVELVVLPSYGRRVVAARSRSGYVDIVGLHETRGRSDGAGAIDTEGHTDDPPASAWECSVVNVQRKSERITSGDGSAPAQMILRCTALAALAGAFLLVGEEGNRVSIWHLCRKRKARNQWNDESTSVQEADLAAGNARAHDAYSATSFSPADTTTCITSASDSVFVSGDSGGKIHVWGFDRATVIAFALAHFPCRHFHELLRSCSVTAVHVVASLRLLYVGDSVGGVAVFDLMDCIGTSTQAATLHDADQRGGRKAEGLSRAIEAFPGTFLPPFGTPPRTSIDIHSVRSWDAHPESQIAQLTSLPCPLVLITVSSDSEVFLWHLGGSPIGYLLSDRNVIMHRREAMALPSGVDFRPASIDDDEGSTEVEVDDGRRGPFHAAASFCRPTNHTGTSRKKSLVSFLHEATPEFFGDPVSDGGRDGVEAASGVTMEASFLLTEVDAAGGGETDVHPCEPSPAGGDGWRGTGGRRARSDRDTKDAFLHRYNDLPPPYGLASVAARKNTMRMLNGLLLPAVDEPGDANDDVRQPQQLLRKLSTAHLDMKTASAAAADGIHMGVRGRRGDQTNSVSLDMAKPRLGAHANRISGGLLRASIAREIEDPVADDGSESPVSRVSKREVARRIFNATPAPFRKQLAPLPSAIYMKLESASKVTLSPTTPLQSILKREGVDFRTPMARSESTDPDFAANSGPPQQRTDESPLSTKGFLSGLHPPYRSQSVPLIAPSAAHRDLKVAPYRGPLSVPPAMWDDESGGAVITRHLPPSMFPSTQRLSDRRSKSVTPTQDRHDIGMMDDASAADAHHTGNTPPVSVMSPVRMIALQAQMKTPSSTMGEKTLRRLHEALYKPLEDARETAAIVSHQQGGPVGQRRCPVRVPTIDAHTASVGSETVRAAPPQPKMGVGRAVPAESLLGSLTMVSHSDGTARSALRS